LEPSAGMTTSDSALQAKRQIRLLTILICLSNLGTLALLDYREPLIPQAMLYGPLMAISFTVCYFFYYGHNWARILVLIGAFLSVFNFLALLSAPSWLHAALFLADGVLAVYLILVLNRDAIRDYFKKKVSVPENSKVKRRKFFIVLAILLLVLAALAGAVAAGVRTFFRQLEQMDLWVESLQTGEQQLITAGDINEHAHFSSDSKSIVYVHRTASAREPAASLNLYVLDTMQSRVLYKTEGHLADSYWDAGDKAILFRQTAEGRSRWMRYDLEQAQAQEMMALPEGTRTVIPSPDGQRLLLLEGQDKGEALYLVERGSGKKELVAQSQGFLDSIQLPRWSPGARRIAYVNFLKLVVMDLNGYVRQDIDLAGLNNFAGLQFHPSNPETLILKARPAQSASFRFNLYSISRITGTAEMMRPNVAMLETGHEISPDGRMMVYTRASFGKKPA